MPLFDQFDNDPPAPQFHGHVVDKLRVAFDPATNFVSLMCGNFCLDQMTLDDYHATFGLRAARQLMTGQ